MTEEPNTNESMKSSECEDVFGGPVFEPRLYIQRYFYAQQQLARFGVKHVVDFGSAECKISRFLVRIPTLQKLGLVDLDQYLLECNKYAIWPSSFDYLEKRDLPLHVQLYCGSVTDLDTCIVDCDGVSMVEIIEHLQPDVLSAAMENVFGRLQPKVVVITTPNADFNVLFPNFSGIRHWDHKFEWSRQEFQNWCDEHCRRYPYSVEYGGIGEPPAGSDHLGHCSQSAVFIRIPDIPKEKIFPDFITSNYRLIAESFYPFKENRLSEEETILLEINYQLRQYRRSDKTVTGSCKICGCNRSLSELEVSSRNKEELGSSTENSNLKTGIAFNGSQSSLTNSGQLVDRDSNQTRNIELDSDSQGNQSGNVNPESDRIGNQSTELVSECPDCENCDRKLTMDKCYVPISCLLSNRIKHLLQPEKLRKFLQSHGYRLTADGNHVIVTIEDNHSSSSDGDDDNLETCQSAGGLDPAISSEIPSNPQFNLSEALDCELWD